MSERLKVALVSGGHPYELQALHAALRALPGMDVYPQHMDDWTAAGKARFFMAGATGFGNVFGRHLRSRIGWRGLRIVLVLRFINF